MAVVVVPRAGAVAVVVAVLLLLPPWVGVPCLLDDPKGNMA